ncbi:MAG: right-handed parallel beta-helix repeat-containing protein [Rikenellaceae bacterium]
MKKLFLALAAILTVVTTSATPFVDNFPKKNNEIRFESKTKYSRTIYVDAKSGNNQNSGLSESEPLKTLAALPKLQIKGGDQILLKGGQIHWGTIELVGLNKGGGKQIHIGSYGTEKATIDFKGLAAGILIENTSNVVVTDLRITADGTLKGKPYMIRPKDEKKRYRYGIFVNSAGEKLKDIAIDNVDIKDVYYFNKGDENTPKGRPCHEWSTNGEFDYGWGIRALSRAKGAGIENLKVTNCHISEVSHTAIKMNANKVTPIKNLLIEGCTLTNIGGPGAQFSSAHNAIMRNCKTVGPGARTEPRMWGRGSGMWLVYCDNFLFEKNYYEGSEGVADCCGAHIDIGNKSVVIQYCVSKNNCGGFVEILGRNENCSYRYNISINDGWRNTLDQKQDAYWMWKQKSMVNGKEVTKTIGAMGALMTVNGHTQNHFVGPYNSYIYNNTIICTESRKDGYTNPFIFDMATSAEGICVMNNLFWIPAQMNVSKSGHWMSKGEIVNNAYDFRVADGTKDAKNKLIIRDFTPEEMARQNLVIKNNLYKLYDPKFPQGENVLPENKFAPESKHRYLDQKAVGGDPKFKGVISEQMQAEDAIPTNAKAIDQGAEVEKLSSDKTAYGVLPQLKMGTDFFGNKIKKPIVGACVAQ